MTGPDSMAPSNVAWPHSVVVYPAGKLNVFLEVLGRRDDGYHDIETVMVATDWADRLTLRRCATPGVHLTCDRRELPTDSTNLVVRALAALPISGGGGWQAHLEKHLPMAAGMGGGSADAAAALVAGHDLLNLGWCDDTLRQVAAKLGSDVPFFVSTQPRWEPDGQLRTVGVPAPTGAICRGRGEHVEPFAVAHRWCWVVAVPPFGCSTPAVYGHLRATAGADLGRWAGQAQRVRDALTSGDTAALVGLMANRLEAPAVCVAPALAGLIETMRQAGALAAMVTGSGSAVVGLVHDDTHAHAVIDTAVEVLAKQLNRGTSAFGDALANSTWRVVHVGLPPPL